MMPLFVKECAPFGPSEYRRCERCSFVFSDHIERTRQDLVTGYYRECSFEKEDPGYVSRARTAFSGLSEICRKSGLRLENLSLLDYGCGEGTFLSICRERALKVRGYDPYPAGPKVADLMIPQDAIAAHKGSFDLVTCFEVVEHATSPDIFAALVDFLMPGGHLVFSTGIYNSNIHNDKWEYFVPAHCSFYSVRSLEILARKLGVRRKFLLRHPFVDIPYILSGEVWQKTGEGTGPIPDSRTVEGIDESFATSPKILRKHFFRAVRAGVYRRSCFV